jgi:uncharacterized tellurite resistance protein B-like protein
MLKAVRNLLRLEPAAKPGAGPNEVATATAALLYKMAVADLDLADEEQRALRTGVERLLDLSNPQELEALLEAGRELARESVSLYDFTAVLHRDLDLAGKAAIVELLWRIAFADGAIDPHEEHLVRKVAGLLHLPHPEFIAAKQRARDAPLPGAETTLGTPIESPVDSPVESPIENDD